MKESNVLRLSLFLALLVFAACLAGIVDNSLYQDGEWFRAQYFGQDVVTLLVVLPLLLISARHGLDKNITAWKLIFIAALLYLVYVYAIFVLVASFSPLYFLHLPIFSLSLFMLISLMGCFFISRRKILLPGRKLRLFSALYLLLLSGMLSYLWISDLLKHTFFPEHQSATPDGEPLLIVYSLDLGVMIPLMLIGVFGLFRNQTRGIAWAGIMLAKSFLLGFALLGMSVSMFVLGQESDPFLMGLWSVISFIGVALTALYMNSLVDAMPEGKA
jgi:hypothetical protein